MTIIKKYISGNLNAAILIALNIFFSLILAIFAISVFESSSVFAYAYPLSYLFISLLALLLLLMSMVLMYISAWRNFRTSIFWSRYVVFVAIPLHLFAFGLAPILITLVAIKQIYFVFTGENLILFDPYI